ncbi:MAG: flagellar motor switch protein FliM [Pseudomonadales bacterium]|jgi:flagellar motor switch protein FliM
MSDLENKLTPEELEALRSESIGNDSNRDNNREYIVVNHDLASEESFLGFNESSIDMINERFARQLRVGLVDVLRTTPRLNVEKVRTLRYQNFLQTLTPPLSVNTVKVDPLRGYSLVVIEPNVIFSSLDNFFGGFGSSDTTIPPGRVFTPTENSIIRILLSLVFGAMKEAYAPILPIEFSQVASEINPQFAQIADDNDLVLVSKVSLTLSDDVEGCIYIVMPFASLKPIRDLLRSRVQTTEDNEEKDQKWRGEMFEACVDSRLDIRINLAQIPSSIQRLKELNVDDVIFFNKPDQAWAEINGLPVFTAEIGSVGKNAAARINEFIELKEQDQKEPPHERQ